MAIMCHELNAWSDQMGDAAYADACAEYRRRYDRDGTRKEVFAFLIATKGTERIKAVWEWLETASGEEMVARKGAAPAGLGR
jgi:hypothetical protein